MHSRQSLCLDYVFLRYQKNAGRKYSLKEGNLSTVRKAHPTEGRGGEGSSGEGEEGKSEEIEMESPLVHVVAEDNETHEEDGATVEEKYDYFQDPTSMCRCTHGKHVPTLFLLPRATHRPNTDPEVPRVCEGHTLRWRGK